MKISQCLLFWYSFLYKITYSVLNRKSCGKADTIPEMSVNPWAFMNYSDNGILLWIEGKDTVANPKRMFRVFL